MTPDEMKRMAELSLKQTKEAIQRTDPSISPDVRALAGTIEATLLTCCSELCYRMDVMNNALDGISHHLHTIKHASVDYRVALHEAKKNDESKGTGNPPAGVDDAEHDGRGTDSA